MDDTLRALYSIDPSKLSYDEWLEIGIALKAEGYPVSTWADWSMQETGKRAFKQKDLDKWGGFDANTMTKATIFHYAKLYGNYTAHRALSWDDGLKANYEEVLTAQKPVEDEQPYEMAIRYLETLYKPDEWVSYVTSAEFKEEQHKWVPANGGSLRKCEDIIKDLKEGKDIEAGFGTMNAAAGAWIRHNPAKGPNDKDVTAFRHVLVESDVLDIEDQKKILIESELPISALIESGGKSIHAIVKIDAADEAEYKKRVNFLFEYMSNKGFVIDKNNKNPARLSRLPGAMRGDKRQKLIGTNLGRASWLDWKDFVDGVLDDLPEPDNLYDMMQEEDKLPDEVIASILYEGGKLMITGDSKSGKTCLSQNLACCIAAGKPWLGKYQCKQGKVLYINLEIRKDMLKARFKAIYNANGWKLGKELKNLRPWNLRGKAMPLSKLAPSVIRMARNHGPFIAIVIDPVYKVQQGDENSAEAISQFCCALDQIAEATGACIIYDHHHPKGEAGARKAIDRGAGSGVFARDADALVDITNLDPGNDASDLVLAQMKEGKKPMEISFVLRDFPDQPTQKIWFDYPLHVLDSAHTLDNCYVEGSDKAHFGKNPNLRSADEKKRLIENAFNEVSKDGFARLRDMIEELPIKTSKTVRDWISEGGVFKCENGIVTRL